MKAIFLKEIRSFFGSAIAYLVIAVFLVLAGLFTFVFEGDYNVLNSGYADFTPFFNLCPWILMFLVPAVTMKSFSDEFRMGTIELLLTKPITHFQLLGGKLFAAFFLVLFALLPTLFYLILIGNLAYEGNSLDSGSIIGSYAGLCFLILAFSSIGTFASTLSDNQIVSFIVGLLICFLMYFGFESIASSFGSFTNTVEKIGMSAHFSSMSRGVIDSRDLIYFLSIAALFSVLTLFRLQAKIK